MAPFTHGPGGEPETELDWLGEEEQRLARLAGRPSPQDQAALRPVLDRRTDRRLDDYHAVFRTRYLRLDVIELD